MATKALPSVVAGAGGLSRYLEEIRKFPMLEPDEEFMLAKRWQEHEDSEAAHKLVTSHLRLVTRIAMGYRGYGLPIGEVISEGNVGLMQAVKRFDPDKGFRLATYAMWWIRASIQEYILRSWSLVKMGTTAAQKKLFFNLRRMKGQIKALEEGDLRPDQVKQIATKLGVPEDDVISMNRRLGGDASLNAPVRAADAESRRVAGLAGRRHARARRSGSPNREELDQRKGYLAEAHVDAERSREAHLRGAAPGGGAGDAGGPVGRVRRQSASASARSRCAPSRRCRRPCRSRRARTKAARRRPRRCVRRPKCDTRGGVPVVLERRPDFLSVACATFQHRIRRRRSGRRSSPWSTPPRSPSRTSPSRPRTHRLPRKRGAGSASRRSGRRGCRST